MSNLFKKAAVFTDIHFGMRQNSKHHNEDCVNFIKWFCETFVNDSDVGLIIKTNAGRQTHLDRNFVLNVFNRTLSENNLQSKDGPKFYLLHGQMTEAEPQ